MLGWPELVVIGAMLIGGLISLALFVFWIWMLVHAIQNKGLSEGEKIGWILAVVFLPFLGSLLYFFIGRPKANQPSIGI
jgi:hypothetical protein